MYTHVIKLARHPSSLLFLHVGGEPGDEAQYKQEQSLLRPLYSIMTFHLQQSSTPPSLSSYRSYLSHVRSSKSDPTLINTLYLRSLANHCLDTGLWKEYLTFLVSGDPCVYRRLVYCKSKLP